MKSRLTCLSLALFAAASLSSRAELPPEKLLPADTIAVFTVPDMDRAGSQIGDSAMNRLWKDPSMKAFADKLGNKFREDVLTPIERELGVKFGDYSDLARGQVTMAITQNGWKGGKEGSPGAVLIVDAKGQADALKKTIADLRKKWADGGKQMKSEKIRDAEFTILVNAGEELGKSLDKAFPGAKAAREAAGGGAAPGAKSELLIGQSGSLLLIGNRRGDLEKILARQSGGSAPALGEQPLYEANHAAHFRNATMYGWVNARTLVELLTKAITDRVPADDANPLGLQPQNAITALGFAGLRTVAFNLNQSKEGTFVQFFLGVPEAERRGLIKLLVVDRKDAAPPAFVPGDVTKFARIRLDGQKFWATIEEMVNELSPQLGALMQLGVANAGKDKDPNFDFKKNVIGNLGTDILMLQKAPRSAKLADLDSPPQIFLIGSPKPEELSSALRTAVGSFTEMKERELLGRKVYSVELPAQFGPDGKPVQRSLTFAASGGYLAVTFDTPMLEDYLRSSESKLRPLSETGGLADAAQMVGGTGTGWFGYENESETLRILMDALKQDPDYLSKMFSVPGVPLPAAGAKGFKDWFDFTLLPTFDKVAKYFHFTVQSANADATGISFKTFVPTPPGVK
ncbi:MAG: hypothetical protein FJ386_07325 [Verrucomicrobia bacterium]|nr:hypothetical protein [Verrucomicrobiota bacterium]